MIHNGALCMESDVSGKFLWRQLRDFLVHNLAETIPLFVKHNILLHLIERDILLTLLHGLKLKTNVVE